MGWFDNEADLKIRHGETLDVDEIDDWLALTDALRFIEKFKNKHHGRQSGQRKIEGSY